MEFNSKNPELQTHKITMSEHAYQKAAERFNKKNRMEALGYFRGILRQANRIGKIISEDGNTSILYAYNRIAIHLNEELTTIITVYYHDAISYEPLKPKIIELIKKEFNKLDRMEKIKLHQLHKFKLEANVEISKLQLRMNTTKSEKVKMECRKKIEQLNELIKREEKGIQNIIDNKRQISKSLVSLL